MPLTVDIVTPDRKVFSSTCDAVVLPTLSGETGVLPGHVPLITRLKAGELRITRDSGTETIAVAAGFARILGDTVSILTDAAIDIAEIDLAEVESAQARAEEALANARAEGADPQLIERFESNIRFAIAQKLIKGKRR